ncbi:hypothetical protein MJG53_012559 [Ovis ammon polii x Ovis aries]|uniref:Uncharacterized protein n=2 Tax=Ovis TaxID=9935 RepID=A0A836CT14_SHEEP|nr:hypothetical protein JEQ12_007627 [Ovis aries]KAI4572721.1 hypothetical protein MJG53_012559 [Ovis ammon polii x Ovis aries]
MGARARSPLRRVCGLDEFTLPSIPEYDHVGKREPCGCVWTRVNTDPGAATGALLCPGERLKGKPAALFAALPGTFSSIPCIPHGLEIV